MDTIVTGKVVRCENFSISKLPIQYALDAVVLIMGLLLCNSTGMIAIKEKRFVYISNFANA